MNINIRKGNIQDLSDLVYHNCAMAMETECLQLDDITVHKGVSAVLQDSQKGFYLIAETESGIAGSLMITFEWSDWRNRYVWWIQSVYVREAYRGKGIYKALYQEVEKIGKGSDILLVRLYVESENSNARKVYEKLGMQESHYRLYEAEWEKN